MFELTWMAQLINLVTGFVFGFAWAAGTWTWNRLAARRTAPASQQPGR